MDFAYQYPPELFQLLVDTIPRLCRSKKDVLLFFRGAGVAEPPLAKLRQQLKEDAASINKFEIVRAVLAHVNELGDGGLRERREILKRVVEFEDFSTCWPTDQLTAKGLVGEIRRVVNVKDAFSKINIERDREVQARREAAAAKQKAVEETRSKRDAAKKELFVAFAEAHHQKRGTMLERAINQLFLAHSISVRESFRVSDENSGTTLEQIDGVIEIDGHLYFTEVK